MLTSPPLLHYSSNLSFPINIHHLHHPSPPPLPLSLITSPFPKYLIPLTSTYAGLSPTNSTNANTTIVDEDQEEEEEEYQVLTATRSEYNNIVILESANSKVLLLDDSGNIHSLIYNNTIWTGSYWDVFSTLPPIIPQGGGPIAIFGLGGGTVAHQLLHCWPTLRIHGWELDEILVDRVRQHMGLSQLEEANEAGGVLRVCTGDALAASAPGEGVKYAGIIVDLFQDAKVLPQMEKVETWLQMKEKLVPNGRIMVNCGSTNETIEALCGAFGGNMVNWKKMPDNQSGNYLAMTGPLPNLDIWSASLPHELRSSVKLWKPCHQSS